MNIKSVSVDIPIETKCVNMVSSSRIIKPNESKPRAITQDSSWIFSTEELSYNNQQSYIAEMKNGDIIHNDICVLISKQIVNKIAGYRSQDMKKKMYRQEEIIDKNYVIDLLDKSGMTCYYCKQPINVLYKTVRDPLQWTLDRIDNSIGHNRENVEIACLKCNVGRKTMDQSRYTFTKQLVIVKTS
mgnify:CR=1 FL=1|jgi:hypothetical protein